MAAAAASGLAGWAERPALRHADRLAAEGPVSGRLRFVFCGRVSTQDWQDPVMSRARQLGPETAAGRCNWPGRSRLYRGAVFRPQC